MTDTSSIAACLAEQLRLLGYTVTAPPPAAPAPAGAAPVHLKQEDAQEAQEAESPPAKYDFAVCQGLYSGCRAYLGMPQPAGQPEPPGERGSATTAPILIRDEAPGGFDRPTGANHDVQSFFLEPSLFAAAAARATERVKLPAQTGTAGRQPPDSSRDAGSSTAGRQPPDSSRDAGSSTAGSQPPGSSRDAGLMAAAIIRGRSTRGQENNSQGAANEGSPERRRSVVGGPPVSEATLSRQTVTSIATVTIPSRRNTETDFGSQHDGCAPPPFWEPTVGSKPNIANRGEGFGGFYGGGFSRGGFGDFSSPSGFGRSFPASASADANPCDKGANRWEKKGGGEGSSRKDKAPAGKAGGRPRRPGVDVRCPACGFLRNRGGHDF